MTGDFALMFGVVAIQRRLATPEQLINLLKQRDQTVSLDMGLVRAGYLSSSGRLELLSEVEALTESRNGDVRSAIESAREADDVDRFVSAYESIVKPAHAKAPGSDADDDGLHVTFDRVTSAATGEASDLNSHDSRDLSRDVSSDDSFSETVISRVAA